MIRNVISALLLSVAIVSSASRALAATSRLMTMADGVVAYSGPGEFYRPLMVFPNHTEIKALATPIQTKDGAFYKVLVKLSDKKSVIGYVSVAAMANIVSDKLDDDDLTKYGDVALVNKGLQVSLSSLRNSGTMVTLGYMKYLSTGFYVKGFAGQYSVPDSNATIAGGEIANDALLFGHVSGVVSYGLGLFAPKQPGAIFQASSSVNLMMQASFGARYNFGGIASMSAAATQAVFFNSNNSLVTNGATITFEVGL